MPPRTAVRHSAIPCGALAREAFPSPNYADCYAATLPPGVPPDVDAFVRACFKATPDWVDRLMAARNLIVRPFGIKAASDGPRPDIDEVALIEGSGFGLFNIKARSEHEILLGEDDKHLDFRAGFLVRRAGDRVEGSISTVVRFNGWLGRAYFAPVRLAHGTIVSEMLRHTVRQLDREVVDAR